LIGHGQSESLGGNDRFQFWRWLPLAIHGYHRRFAQSRRLSRGRCCRLRPTVDGHAGGNDYSTPYGPPGCCSFLLVGVSLIWSTHHGSTLALNLPNEPVFPLPWSTWYDSAAYSMLPWVSGP